MPNTGTPTFAQRPRLPCTAPLGPLRGIGGSQIREALSGKPRVVINSASMKKIPEITLGGVGRCVYCGTSRGPFSAEHVVPYGLNGPWKLLGASCSECAKLTSAFERRVLRGPFNEARIAMRLPSRRKNERPEQLPLSVQREGKTETEMLPVEDYPALIILPHFGAPAYLDGREDERVRAVGQTTFQVGGRPFGDLGRELSAESIEVSLSYEPVGAFARMLAKVAYGFAVAAVGCDLNQFEDVYVLPAILGRSDDVGRWVGGVEDEEPAAVSDLHRINLTVRDGDVLVRVRLFAQHGAPEYLVVVGRLATARSLADLGLPRGAQWVY